MMPNAPFSGRIFREMINDRPRGCLVRNNRVLTLSCPHGARLERGSPTMPSIIECPHGPWLKRGLAPRAGPSSTSSTTSWSRTVPAIICNYGASDFAAPTWRAVAVRYLRMHYRCHSSQTASYNCTFFVCFCCSSSFSSVFCFFFMVALAPVTIKKFSRPWYCGQRASGDSAPIGVFLLRLPRQRLFKR